MYKFLPIFLCYFVINFSPFYFIFKFCTFVDLFIVSFCFFFLLVTDSEDADSSVGDLEDSTQKEKVVERTVPKQGQNLWCVLFSCPPV